MFQIDKKIIPMLDAAKVASVAAAGTLVSGWIDVSQYQSIHTVAQVGAGGGTPALSFQQATSSGGAGAKALAAWAIGALATDRIEVDNAPENLDINNSFRFVQVTVTITGGAGTLTSLLNLGVFPRFTA